MSCEKKILIFGFDLKKMAIFKKTIHKNLRKKGVTRQHYVVSTRPTEGNIAGLRGIEHLNSIIITEHISDSLLGDIKKNSTVRVYMPWELHSLIKKLS